MNAKKHIDNISSSSTLDMKLKLENMIKNGHQIYKFGIGQSPFPVPENMVFQLSISSHFNSYVSSQGLYELRSQIADFYKKYTITTISPEQIIIGPGSKELLHLVQMVFDCDIIVPNPSWVSYIPQAKINSNNVLLLDTTMDNNWKITTFELEKILKNTNSKKMLILNSPNNPTGQVYTECELINLSKILRKYNTLVLSDEIYSEFSFTEHHSIYKYYPENTIICSGISKFLSAGGWRLGFLIVPNELSYFKNLIINIASETFGSVAHPIQLASIVGFDTNTIQPYTHLCKKILMIISNYIYDKLVENNIMVKKSMGAFYLFPNFNSKLKAINLLNEYNSIQNMKFSFCQWVFTKLLDETGIGVLPGTDFGRPSNELTCRISFVDFDGNLLIKKGQTEIINNNIIQYCPNITEGISNLIKWWNT